MSQSRQDFNRRYATRSMFVHRVPALKGRPKVIRPLRGQIQSAPAHSKIIGAIQISSYTSFFQMAGEGARPHSQQEEAL
jgi:hypothetical protein